jgi:hypothetical protein
VVVIAAGGAYFYSNSLDNLQLMSIWTGGSHCRRQYSCIETFRGFTCSQCIVGGAHPSVCGQGCTSDRQRCHSRNHKSEYSCLLIIEVAG